MYITSIQDIKPNRSGLLSNFKLLPIVKSRVARSTDLPALNAMKDWQTATIFGTCDLESALESSFLCIVVETAEDEVVGALFFNNFPNLPAIPPWDWVNWIQRIYHLVDNSSRNTLFLHLAVCNARYLRTFFQPILETVFKMCVYVKYVIMIVPPQKKFLDFLCPKASIVQPFGLNIQNSQNLVLYLRHDFITSYKMRRAVVEDNDDLVALVDTHSKRLRNVYGNYYFAEIVSDQYSKRHAIVSEYKEIAVGVILFNEQVNLDLLSNCFHLECFYGLRKFTSSDDTPASFLSVVSNTNEGVIPPVSSRCDSSESNLLLLHKCSFEAKATKQCSSGRFPVTLEDVHRNDSKNIELTMDSVSFLSCVGSFPTLAAEEFNSGEKSDTLKGFVDGKFTFNMLRFTEQQLLMWQEVPRQHGLTCSASLTLNLLKLLTKTHIYHGETNAFTLEIMAAWPNHEVCLPDLLQAGFELFPERDYCVMCVPSQAPYFHQLSQTFIRVSPLPMSNFPHELYVVHRNSLACNVHLRCGELRDQDQVKKLLQDMRNGEEIFRTFREYLVSTTDRYQTYVVLSDTTVVGVVNVKDLDNMAYVLARYQLSRMTDMTHHRPGCHGRIQHFVLSPIFQRHARFLLQDLHRLTDYSLLLYFIYPEDMVAAFRLDPLNCILNELMPVMPAKVPEFSKMPSEDLGWTVPEIMIKVERPYAVYMSTLMHSGLPRFTVNTKIVVVGASQVGLSFLIELLFNNNPHLHPTFNNVTVVSTNGLPDHKSNKWQQIMLPLSSETTSGYYLSLMSLVTYVNVVKGVMSAIDRKNKTITANSMTLPYDLLFLTCGTQFQAPVRLHSGENDGILECPENVFVVNTEFDVNLAIVRLKTISSDESYEGKYIVYGNCLEAYCCLEAFLQFELPPSEIIFVIPPYSESSGTFSAFSQRNVEEAILDEITSLGVTVYNNYNFIDWTFNKNNIKLDSITFEGITKVYEIPVKLIFMYQTKRISPQTFMAINKANLIFDGALVISPEFQTNDPNIFAAGRMTKYPRKYYAEHMRHEYFNQNEIGYNMAHLILRRLLPAAPDAEEDLLFIKCRNLEGKMLVPRYTKPVMLFAMIPNGVQYLYIRKPGIIMPMVMVEMDDIYGHVMTTGNCRNLNDQGYFLLHLNQYNTIETIIAVSKSTAIERTNLMHLWGKHEALLNNLTLKYKMGRIKDLFKFLSRPWLHALFKDEYEVLEKNLRNSLLRKTDEPGMSLIEDIIKKIQDNNNEMLTSEQHVEVMEKFLKSEYHSDMENRVLQFLAENDTYLPMYGTKGALSILMGNYAESPLFTEM